MQHTGKKKNSITHQTLKLYIKNFTQPRPPKHLQCTCCMQASLCCALREMWTSLIWTERQKPWNLLLSSHLKRGSLIDGAARLAALLWDICRSLAHEASRSSVFSGAWHTRAPGNVRAATWTELPRTPHSPRTGARTGRWRTYPLSEKHHRLTLWIIQHNIQLLESN